MNSPTEVERICLAALEHPVSERAAFLVEACQGDEALRHEVESLLAHASPAEQFLAQPALHTDAALAGLSGLSIGQRLGAYQIVAKLGAGGMGEVYRGRDTRLGRDVAIKILPVVFAADPERLARFEREARLLASLNHPHIAAIYGIETGPEETGHQVRALVMELVEGVALSDRIARGPVPVTEALAIAQQIADALAAAHEQGIIHRDLKPANIRLRPDGTVKVLDFGLAKALPDSSALAPPPAAVTTAQMTEAGFILGTAAYMSPEQARGELVDQRTDIWAFGCVLYEMLTGRVAFDGRTATDTLAKVLEGHADLDALPATTPLAIRRLIRRCLERPVGNRLQHIGDARADIADVRAGDPLLTIAPASAGQSSRARAWAVAAVALALLAGAGVWFSARRSPADVGAAAVVRFDVPRVQAPAAGDQARSIELSPDGSKLAYTTESGLRIRALDGEDVLLPVGHQPFFSPDGKWLAFFSDHGLQRMPAGGGPVETIAPDIVGTERTFGASWAPDGTIVLSRGGSLWRVNASGGTTELVGAPDTQFDRYAWPEFLPDGHSVLFTILGRGGAADARIAMIDLTSHRQTTILPGGHAARYVPTGYLLYASSGGWLQAVRFDGATGDSHGVPVRVEGVQILQTTGGFHANFAVSRTGMLAYLPSGPEPLRSMAWVDPSGREEPIAAEPKQYAYPRISPDGTRVALDVLGENRDIWVLQFARKNLTRITFGPTEDLMPAWSKDGARVYYGSDRKSSAFGIFSVAADGSGGEREEFAGSDPSMPLSMATPNELLVFTSGPGTRDGDIGVVTLTGKPRMRTLLGKDGAETNAQVSPDGQWLTYQSVESGSSEVWVVPYPAVDGRREHIGAGVQPLWGRAGSNELYYWSLDGKLKVVSVTLSPDLVIGATRDVPLREHYHIATVGAWNYQVSPTDGRLLLLKPVPGSEALSPIKVILNWTERLKRLVPPT